MDQPFLGRTRLVPRMGLLAVLGIALSGGLRVQAQQPPPPSSPPPSSITLPSTTPSSTNAIIAEISARLIADAIPRDYSRTKDWGRTRQITTGLRSSGNFFEFDIHRRKSSVPHGIWKAYRVTLVDPDENLEVRVENLRQTANDRIALTLLVSAKLRGWSRAKIYENGIHLGAFEAEGRTVVRLRLDTEISITPGPSTSFIPAMVIRPTVQSARLELDDFRLERISDLKGGLVKELSSGLRELVEDQLAGPKLTEKINHAIDKRADRLTFTADMLFGKSSPRREK